MGQTACGRTGLVLAFPGICPLVGVSAPARRRAEIPRALCKNNQSPPDGSDGLCICLRNPQLGLASLPRKRGE
jgi:hypothetical protein